MNSHPDQPTDGDDHGELLPTRASLLERLRQWSDNASWQEFFDTYWKLIFRTARAAGLRSQDAEEVVQETIVEVAKDMPDFQYRPPAEGGSFKQWLLNKTRWRIIDHMRGYDRHTHAISSDDQENLPAPMSTTELLSPVLDAQWDHEWEVSLVDRALQRLKRQVDTRNYQIFYFLELKGWTPREVGRQVGVSLPVVYTTRFRLRKLFRTILNKMKEEE